MARILVLGADGQLGQELKRARAPAKISLLFASRGDIDIASERSAEALARIGADTIINAAAYTAVDRAESEAELAFAVNRDAAARVASVAAATGAHLIHLSTDYVFAGDKAGAYRETDKKAPLNVYGRSKSEGEDAVLANHPGALVLRTSWVFSPFGSNFVKSMLRLAETRDEAAIVADQIGRPTAASDLVEACLAIAALQLAGCEAAAGVFHYAGAGEASWADFAEAIFSEAAQRGRRPVRVKRISGADYPTPAKRPLNSRLDTAKIETTLGIVPRPWREGLSDCLDGLVGI